MASGADPPDAVDADNSVGLPNDLVEIARAWINYAKAIIWETDIPATSEKKQKAKKQKTDPNLFLFSDVVEDNATTDEDSSLEEISTISENSQDSSLDEDIDTPSYLRKGTGH